MKIKINKKLKKKEVWHKANAVLKIDADVLVGHLDED